MRNLIFAIIVAALVAVGAVVVASNHSSKQTNNAAATTPSNSKQASQTNEPTVNNAILITKSSSATGNYLADPNGNTLYTYNKDSAAVSNCTGQCLVEWPAYLAKGATTGLPTGVATITRTDNGQMQYTYNGKPLYYFKEDSAGKVTGNGADGFQVAKPVSASTQQSSAPSGTSPNYAY